MTLNMNEAEKQQVIEAAIKASDEFDFFEWDPNNWKTIRPNLFHLYEIINEMRQNGLVFGESAWRD